MEPNWQLDLFSRNEAKGMATIVPKRELNERALEKSMMVVIWWGADNQMMRGEIAGSRIYTGERGFLY
jgi:hypothetical protein